MTKVIAEIMRENKTNYMSELIINKVSIPVTSNTFITYTELDLDKAYVHFYDGNRMLLI